MRIAYYMVLITLVALGVSCAKTTRNVVDGDGANGGITTLSLFFNGVRCVRMQ